MKPETLLHNWDIPPADSITPSKTGLLNQTFLIRAGGELFVLQKLHPAVSMDGAINNYFHVTQFLKEQGLVTQTLLPTTNGKLWVDADGSRWRMLRGVEGINYSSTTDHHLAEEAGMLLGQMDAVLADYPGKLEVGRKSHQYEGVIAKLQEHQQEIALDPDESIRNAGTLLLEELPELLLPKDLPQSITHTDPKISNFLFDEHGKGICMIDLDTLQILSPLYQIGDAIRSWCGKEEDSPENTFNPDMYRAFISGYLATSKGLLSEREQFLLPQAVQLVMLGLTARFLNDYIEDSYFGWDHTKYDSRKAHNKARVMSQISLYQSYLKSQ